MMLKLLLRTPRWLGVVLASLAAAALLLFSTLGPNLTGWWLVISVILAMIFAVLAIAIPQLQQWQAQQAARLQVQLEPTDVR